MPNARTSNPARLSQVAYTAPLVSNRALRPTPSAVARNVPTLTWSHCATTAAKTTGGSASRQSSVAKTGNTARQENVNSGSDEASAISVAASSVNPHNGTGILM